MPIAVLAALPERDPAELERACSADPGNLCRWTFELTGNRQVAQVADWFADVPLQILWIVVVAWIVNRLARRAIRRFGQRIQGISDNDGMKRLRSRTPSVFLSTGEVNVRSAARAETITTVPRLFAQNTGPRRRQARAKNGMFMAKNTTEKFHPSA